MHTKIIIAATIAGLSLATTAFAGEGNGDPFGYHPGLVTVDDSAGSSTQAHAAFDNTTLPENGSNGIVESPNALPRGALVGTAPYEQAQSVNRWLAQAADHRFAERAAAMRPNG